MDITRNNFEEYLPLVSEAVDKALFLSIDGEFSGINNGSYNTALFDSVEERYQKLCCNTTDFLLMQFGLSAFIWNQESSKYEVEVFNFYIFPFHSPYFGSPDRVFSCQSSSVDFLIRQGFDFNKVFKEGIPFLRQNEEISMKALMQEKQAQRESFKTPSKDFNNSRSLSPGMKSSPGMDSLTMDQKTKDFVEKICCSVQEFLNNNEAGSEFALEPCNSYLRKVLYETLPNRFPNQLMLESRFDETTRQRHLVLLRGTNEEMKKEREVKKKLQEEENFQKAIGFSKIIKLITNANKLVIGHNMLLDIMFTIKQFVATLPTDLDEFKTLTTCVFPRILDTKLMASLLPFKDLVLSTTLGDLHDTLKSSPFSPPVISVPENYDVTIDPKNAKLHEAAYDSYITGCCFASMLQFLSSMQDFSDSPSLALIEPYVNKVFLMKTVDLPYMNLGGADLSPDRNHVFHVTFPRSWKAADLRQLFSPFGQILISWISDTSSFVSLYDKTQVKKVKKALAQAEGAEPLPYHLITYSEYQDNIARFKSKNRLWLRNQASETPEKSYCGANLASPSLDSRSVNRKRHADNGESSGSAIGETVAKKLHVQNETNKASAGEDTGSSELFEVPNDW